MDAKDIEEQTKYYDQKINETKNAQEKNYHVKRVIEQAKETIDATHYESQLWLEEVEGISPQQGQMQARINELWDNHEYAAREAEKSFEEAFSIHKEEANRLEKECDRLIDEKKKLNAKTESRGA